VRISPPPTFEKLVPIATGGRESSPSRPWPPLPRAAFHLGARPPKYRPEAFATRFFVGNFRFKNFVRLGLSFPFMFMVNSINFLNI
jgi:hypothetical protein